MGAAYLLTSIVFKQFLHACHGKLVPWISEDVVRHNRTNNFNLAYTLCYGYLWFCYVRPFIHLDAVKVRDCQPECGGRSRAGWIFELFESELKYLSAVIIGRNSLIASSFKRIRDRYGFIISWKWDNWICARRLRQNGSLLSDKGCRILEADLCRYYHFDNWSLQNVAIRLEGKSVVNWSCVKTTEERHDFVSEDRPYLEIPSGHCVVPGINDCIIGLWGKNRDRTRETSHISRVSDRVNRELKLVCYERRRN